MPACQESGRLVCVTGIENNPVAGPDRDHLPAKIDLLIGRPPSQMFCTIMLGRIPILSD
jgi:hypothetical protein